MKSILLNTSNIARLFFAWVILCNCQKAMAERCEPQENNEYEKVLCQLKQSGRGMALPNIYQFRENPPLIQALLLKKTAERAGIMIKIPERDNQETLRRQEELLVSVPTVQDERPIPLNSAVTTVSVIQKQPLEAVQTESKATVTPELVSTVVSADTAVVEKAQEIEPVSNKNSITEDRLAGCSLQQLTLQCANGQYVLVGNKANQQLPANALADDHKLALPVYTGAMDDTDALEHYLATAYDRYLAGMIEIGLGASTMSYTKFANLYHYIVEQHLDFSARFETMYQFLKKDKAAIGVNTKLSIAEGFAPKYCSELENFLACDYQHANYVFIKRPAENSL